MQRVLADSRGAVPSIRVDRKRSQKAVLDVATGMQWVQAASLCPVPEGTDRGVVELLGRSASRTRGRLVGRSWIRQADHYQS